MVDSADPERRRAEEQKKAQHRKKNEASERRKRAREKKRKTLEKFRNQVKEFENQREDIEIALGELRKGIEWLENDLSKIGPANEQAESVAAYDAVARKQLDDA